jgi:hypothetical protein
MLKAIIEGVLVKNRVQHSAVLAREIVDALDAAEAPKAGDPDLSELVTSVTPTETPFAASVEDSTNTEDNTNTEA